MTPPFIVWIVGRPNVGKSSLFNALLGFRRAIVFDKPGTTRDRIFEEANWGMSREIVLVDTQGINEAEEFRILREHGDEADAFLLVTDSTVGVTPYDRELAECLRRLARPVLLCVNKVDVKRGESALHFRELRIENFLEVSAAHKRNLDQVKEWVRTTAGCELVPPEGPIKKPFSVAIVGRPNAGKSTLMNRLARKDVATVSPIAHTTRDPLSIEFPAAFGRVRLWDTAGIRRPRSEKEGIETYSVQFALRTLKQSNIVLLLIRAHEQVTDQDMRLLNVIERSGKPVVVLLNFWDLMSTRERQIFWKDNEFALTLKRHECVPISASTGYNVGRILSTAHRIFEKSHERIPTSRLNEIVRKMVDRNPPPARGMGNFNILYASQVKTRPPTFVMFLNRKGNLPPSYQTYLTNGLKKSLGLKSQSVRLLFR